MFASIRRLLGAIRVVEKDNLITIEGLPTYVAMRDIYNIWSTSKIGQYMFTEVDRSSVSFHKFFAPDVAYTLSTIIRERAGRHYIRAMERVVELLYKETWLKGTLEQKPSILNFAKLKNLTVKLLEHQDRFLKEYDTLVPRYNLKGYLLAAAPGSGKTIANLALGECLEADVVVIISPKNAIHTVWEDTLVSLFKKPTTYWISSTPGAPPVGKRHYVFHYERLDDAVEFFKKHKYAKPLVILDESHNLNEIDSLRTRLFIELCTQALNAQHVIWASGTPVKAIGNEVIPLLMTLDPLFDDEAEQRFRLIFGKNASRAVDILRNRLGMMTFRIDKKVVVNNHVSEIDIKLTIPNGAKYTLDAVREEMRQFIEERMAYYEKHMNEYVRTYEMCLVLHKQHLSPPEREQFNLYQQYVAMIRKQYDPAMMKDIVVFCNNYELREIIPSLPATHRDKFKEARSVVKYYYLKVQGEALGRILGRLRAQCHVDMVPHLDWEEIIDTALKKTLVFTSYVEVIHAMDAHWRKLGYTPLQVYGETNKDLSSIVAKFGKDEDANPLGATYKSLSTAVPMVMANVIVLFNSPFREYERNQAISRVDRLGQDSPVQVINVLLETDGKPNISTRSNDILKWSQEQVSAIMGTPVTDLDVSMEAFSDLVGVDIPPETAPLTERPAFVSW